MSSRVNLKTAALVASLAALVAPAARADFLSFLAYQTLSFQQKTAVNYIVTDLAVAPTGEAMAAACEVGVSGALTLKLWFFDPNGNLVSGPTIVTSPGSIENMAAGAGPTAFCLSYDVTGAPGDVNGHGVYFRTFSLSGAALSSGTEIQANTLTSLDERSPGVAGYPTASGTGFVITWVRKSLTTAATSGLYARRFNALGGAIDAAEVRIDASTDNRIADPKAATWPNGRFVISWTDGLAYPATSPLSNGTGVFARVVNADFSFRTSQFQVPSSTTDDQFQSFVDCDAKSAFVCGWTSFVNSATALGAFVRRYDDLGVALDANDVAATSVPATGGYLLQSVAMDSAGEWCAISDAQGASAGFSAPRCRYRRYAPNRTPAVVEDGVLDPLVNFDSHYNGRVRTDQWGRPHFVHVFETPSTIGVTAVNATRGMIQYDNPAPAVGSTLAVYLDSPNTPNGVYVLGCAFGTGPVNIDWRKLPLSPDPLLVYCLTGAFPTVFQNFTGVLDASGLSAAPTIAVPNDPVLVGFTLYCAFGVVDASWPSSVSALSPAAPFTLQ